MRLQLKAKFSCLRILVLQQTYTIPSVISRVVSVVSSSMLASAEDGQTTAYPNSESASETGGTDADPNYS